MELISSRMNIQADNVMPLEKRAVTFHPVKESVDAGAAPINSAVTAEAFTTLAESVAESEDLKSNHELVVIDPTQEKNADAVTFNAEGAIIGAAVATANAVNAWGLGAAILHHSVGIAKYANILNYVGPTAAATKPMQYLAARGAEWAASKAVNTALIGGVSAGTAASVGLAVLSALTVAEIGVGIHNTFIAKTESDKVSLNPVDLCVKAFKMLTGWGNTAAAA
ncbi:MAG: hypothetical protein H0W50_11510 [Parachlamydiaceae bacterium]|nr:hypothetical protein [Parachlamydiaceae bacterium]